MKSILISCTLSFALGFAACYFMLLQEVGGSKKTMDKAEDEYVEKVLHDLYDGVDSVRRHTVLDSLARAYRESKR